LEKHYFPVTVTRTLQDDLDDFLALVPTDKIIEIALDYLANDAEVQELVVYIQSNEFHGIVTTVEALQEFKNVSAFM
jgi:predicted transcriptional regulator